MNTVLCAYCYHEVEQTKDGVCPFCGGNLAHEPIEEPERPDPEFIIQDEPWTMMGTGKSYLAKRLEELYGVGNVSDEEDWC